MKKFCTYLIFSILLFGCNEKEQNQTKKNVAPTVKEMLVNWSTFNESGFQNVSFPTWFNQKQVQLKNISQIKLFFYDFNEIDTVNTFSDTLPETLLSFDFDKEKLAQMQLEEFSSEMPIAKHFFNYRNKQDSVGYSAPDITNNVVYKDNKWIPIFSTYKVAQVFQRLHFVKKDSVVIEYTNTLNPDDNKHVFILDSANWNVMFIDKWFKPKNNNTFYYGSPKQVHESFKVKNLVEKEQLVKNTYFENNVAYQQSFFTDGFEKRRTFQYDNEGQCVGYVDSLIAIPNDYIEHTISKIQFDKELPINLFTYDPTDSLYENPLKQISFKYEYREVQ
ncbi:MAG: hypothetical protein WEA99_12450 [Brumimicrobium sp.]